MINSFALLLISVPAALIVVPWLFCLPAMLRQRRSRDDKREIARALRLASAPAIAGALVTYFAIRETGSFLFTGLLVPINVAAAGTWLLACCLIAAGLRSGRPCSDDGEALRTGDTLFAPWLLGAVVTVACCVLSAAQHPYHDSRWIRFAGLVGLVLCPLTFISQWGLYRMASRSCRPLRSATLFGWTVGPVLVLCSVLVSSAAIHNDPTRVLRRHLDLVSLNASDVRLETWDGSGGLRSMCSGPLKFSFDLPAKELEALLKKNNFEQYCSSDVGAGHLAFRSWIEHPDGVNTGFYTLRELTVPREPANGSQRIVYRYSKHF